MIIDTWDAYEKRGIEVFDLVGFDDLRHRWDDLVARIRSNVDELRSYHVLLSQKLELFNGMSDGVSTKWQWQIRSA